MLLCTLNTLDLKANFATEMMKMLTHQNFQHKLLRSMEISAQNLLSRKFNFFLRHQVKAITSKLLNTLNRDDKLLGS